MLPLSCSWPHTHDVLTSLGLRTCSPNSRAHTAGPNQPAGKLDGPRHGTSDGPNIVPVYNCDDVESLYSSACASAGPGVNIIYQNIQAVAPNDDLFYTCVVVNDIIEVKGMIDSGSMACMLSSAMVPRLQGAGVLTSEALFPVDVVLVGCGGMKTRTVGACELVLMVYGHKASVPVLVVDGQIDKLIIGSNFIKHLIQVMKGSFFGTQPVGCTDEEAKLFSLLANVERWQGSEVPDKVGTLRLKQAVTLEPMEEHLRLSTVEGCSEHFSW